MGYTFTYIVQLHRSQVRTAHGQNSTYSEPTLNEIFPLRLHQRGIKYMYKGRFEEQTFFKHRIFPLILYKEFTKAYKAFYRGNGRSIVRNKI